MKNSDLKAFYDQVYRKGEKKHYTKLLLSKKGISQEKAAILSELDWRGKEVLDLGCGTGELAFYIANAGAKRVVGIDYSEAAIEIARKNYVHPNLSFECGDIGNIGGKYNVITIVGVLEHIDDPFALLKKVKGFLKPKGSLIITCPNWSNVRGYILMAFKELFGVKITLVDIHYFTPLEFEKWGKKLRMDLKWKTIEQEWGHGEKLIEDFKKRFPPVLSDLPIKVPKEAMDRFIAWLAEHAPKFETDQKAAGAVGFYHFRK